MAERLIINRNAISNVLSDRNVVDRKQAQALEIHENEWETLETLTKILRPLALSTKVLSDAPLLAVNPIILSIINQHMLPALEKYGYDDAITTVINKLIDELQTQFDLNSRKVKLVAKCSFFDARYKELRAESTIVRALIMEEVKNEMESLLPTTADNTKQVEGSALDYIFNPKESGKESSVDKEIRDYFAEPQICYKADAFDWWKLREKKYPLLSRLAKKYLCIPATSVTSERVFSSSGYVVSPLRSCLASFNVAINVFLYQNRQFLK